MKTDQKNYFFLLFALGALLMFFGAVPKQVLAARLQVSVVGSDSSSCGSSSSPCRSISQAIENANGGDTIVVGPGRYGDLDQDGTLGESGEEFGSDSEDAGIVIDKALKLISSAGAPSTVIDINESFSNLIKITVPSVIFGKPNKGFSLYSKGILAIQVEGGQSQVQGNIISGSPQNGIQVGYSSSSSASVDRGKMTDNFVTGSTGTGVTFCSRANQWNVSRNRVTLNQQDGIENAGDGHTFRANAITGNFNNGLESSGDNVTVRRNLLDANGVVGISATGQNLTVIGNSIVGNGSFGLFTNQAKAIQRNNLGGNNPFLTGNFIDCGLFIEMNESPNVDGNYWGSNGGPGSEGSDRICTNTLTPLPEPSFRSKPFKIKIKGPRN